MLGTLDSLSDMPTYGWALSYRFFAVLGQSLVLRAIEYPWRLLKSHFNPTYSTEGGILHRHSMQSANKDKINKIGISDPGGVIWACQAYSNLATLAP